MAQKGTILVAGPDDIARIGIGRILEDGGYHVLYTSDGETGGELIKDNCRSLSLVIIELGLTTGIDNRPIMKAVREYKIPFVYMTLMDFVLDQDAQKEEILAVIGGKVKK